MRVAVFHNPTAGTRTFSGDDIAGLLHDARYDVELFEKSEADMTDALASQPDVLVAAGGDGTVATAAVALWKERSEVPLFVLPIGTSNNIAWTLRLEETTPELIRGLAGARETALDVGVAVAPDGTETPFIEAAGLGFFGEGLRRTASPFGRALNAVRSAARGWPSGEAQVRAYAPGVARHLRRSPARPYKVVADDEDLSGEYVAVEAMNVAAVGPRVRLAPDADWGDGLLDLVLLRAEDREVVASLVESHRHVRHDAIVRRRVRSVELSWPAKRGHLDDEPWPEDEGEERQVRVTTRGAVRLLLPECSGA